MTYEQRIAVIRDWFKSEIAPRFSMPKDVDARIAASDTIEAVNANIAAKHQDLTPILASALKQLTASARSRTLPTVKEFREAALTASKSHTEAATGTISTSSSTYQVVARKVRAGEAIGDQWLRNTMRKELLENTDLTDEDLRPYDLYIAAHKQ